MIGPKTCVYAIGHPLDAESRREKIGIPKPVTIGDNVWIGGGVTILPGVSIGDSTVIAAASVVTKSFPDHVVIAGNPAKIIKNIEESLLIMENGKIYPVEIKMSADPGKNALKNFSVLSSLNEEIGEGAVLCMTSAVILLDENNKMVPIKVI